ncbi:UDP-glucuronosyltransferase 1-6-like [Scaptodrosophila lebanonensis]|uniref:UDP-glucuronosyltransferase 1-6-like n=1 Tax=Drosophila lebanonensis TaxID=7225 RepID=A0A6J2U9G4_DROLE|nr:UDP-glucuronosyltransferase 1-6-like [Scaptodrosophila lebanonensis]
MHMSVVKALAEVGHNVTVVSMLKPTITHKNIHHIYVPPTEEQERNLEDMMSGMAKQKNSIFSIVKKLLSDKNVVIEAQYDLMFDERLQRIYDTKFDLMIQGFFLNEFQLGVAAKLKCPVIINWMQAPMATIDALVGNPYEISYVPNMNTVVKPGEGMGFSKRLENLIKQIFGIYIKSLFNKRSNIMYKQIFGNEPNFPSIEQMRRNISLVFTNSHSISEGPIRPFVPATVEIGGIQVKDKPDPLPKRIQDFLAKSKHGAILLSLGSNIKSSTVKPEIVKTMFNVLSKLKQHVIWKWEDLENTPGTSSNILYEKWLPQDDILAHSKLKLFITHAGKGGITEAQYHGVPMVALPIFGDQHTNSEAMQKSGYGLKLELLQLTEDKFRSTLSEVLENDRYANEIKKFSDLYRDRPLTAKQSVVFWAEYVIRHKGAPNIQSPAVHMCWIAYYNLDVYALIISVLVVGVLLTRLVLKLICRKLSSKCKKSKAKQQ